MEILLQFLGNVPKSSLGTWNAKEIVFSAVVITCSVLQRVEQDTSLRSATDGWSEQVPSTSPT
jgi:hypothetical protein